MGSHAQPKFETGARSDSTRNLDARVMELGNVLSDRQAEARVSVRAPTPLAVFAPVEALEDKGKILWRDAFAGVVDLEPNAACIAAEGEGDAPSGRGMANGVVDQVIEYPFDQAEVGPYERQVVRDFGVDANPLLSGHKLELLRDILDELTERERLGKSERLTSFQLRELEQPRHQLGEGAAVAQGDLHVSASIRGAELAVLEQQRLEKCVERSQGRSEVVGYVRNELPSKDVGAAGSLELARHLLRQSVEGGAELIEFVASTIASKALEADRFPKAALLEGVHDGAKALKAARKHGESHQSDKSGEKEATEETQ